MYCSSCGSLVKDGQSFCANCGAPVTGPASQPAVHMQQPQVIVQPQVVVQPQPFLAQPVAASPAPVKKSKGAAIAAFILGIVTVDFAWIIFVNAVSVVTGLAGTILAIVSLTRKNGRLKAMAVIGLILSFIGMVYSILVWASFWSEDVYQFMAPIVDYFY